MKALKQAALEGLGVVYSLIKHAAVSCIEKLDGEILLNHIGNREEYH